jgi:hypothetical protein
MEYLSIAVVFLGAILAIPGSTWDYNRVGWRKLRPLGWAIGMVAFAGMCVSAVLVHRNATAAAESRSELTLARNAAESAKETIVSLQSDMKRYEKVIQEIRDYGERTVQLVMDQFVQLQTGSVWPAPNKIYAGSEVEVFFQEGDRLTIEYEGQSQLMKRQADNWSRIVISGGSGVPMSWQVRNDSPGNFSGKVLVKSSPRVRSIEWSWIEERLKRLP